MSNTVLPWVKYLVKCTLGSVLWIIRALETWLERMDGEWEVINVNFTDPESEKCEPSESSKEQKEGKITVKGTE